MAERTTRRGRGAPLKPLVDTTPLDGARVDVRVRIAWLLRMARLTGGGERFRRQTDMIAPLRALGIATTPTALSRLESGQHRVGRLVDGYEQVLGMPAGSLRAPIDLACRAFTEAPADRDPGVARHPVGSPSAAAEPVQAGTATGEDWLRWARAMAQPDGKGLPEHLALELASRLVSEMGRAVGPAYPVRYQALALLRCSEYGDLVRAAADAVLADVDCQVAGGLMRAVAERADQASWLWAIGHLADSRTPVVRGAALAMETILAAPGFDPDWWFDALEPLHDLLLAAPEDSEQRGPLAHLFHLLPGDLRRGLRPHLGAVETPPGPVSWDRSERNRDWMRCIEVADEVTRRVGIDTQPVLARLCFDVLMGTREGWARAGLMMLTAVPFTGPVVEQLAHATTRHEDEALGERAHRRLRWMQAGTFPAALTTWFDDDRRRQLTALTLAAQSGQDLPREVVTGLLAAGGGYTRGVLVAAGLAADPILAELAGDAAQPPEIRGAAQWWLREGGRVADAA